WILLPSSRSITGRSFFDAFAWYLNTGKNRDAPPESLCAENSPPLLKPVADPGLPLAPLLAPPLLSTPLCSSISAAACSSSNTLAGKRPLVSGVSSSLLNTGKNRLAPPESLGCARVP